MTRFFISICLFLFAYTNVMAHGAPIFSLDTAGMNFKINESVVDKANVSKILEQIHNEYRIIEKANKKLYVFDGSGFVMEESAEGFSFMLFFSPGEKETEPKNAFSGKLIINGQEITKNTAFETVQKQLPKTEKVLNMKDNFMYLGPELILSMQSKDGVLKEIDFGFRSK